MVYYAVYIVKMNAMIYNIYPLTITQRVTFIHDSDGFMAGEQYPESYNALAMKAYTEGRLKETGCPDIVSRADMPPQMSRVPPMYIKNIPDI